jgi:hypothetical protein
VPVHAPARDRDRAGAEERLQPQHHARRILDHVRVRPRQLAQCRALRAAVVDGPQVAAQEPLGEHVRVDHVGLVAAVFPAPVAHHDLIDQRAEQVVQPLRLGALLEDDVHGAAHAGEELGERAGLRRHDAAGDHAPAGLADRGNRRGLVDVERHVLRRSFHEGRSWVGSERG